MFKGFRQIVSLTLFSRIVGLVREMCFAYYFGAGALMDIWFIAFKIPNLSRRLFGEGAASASFIPVYSQELHERKESAAAYANTIVTAVVAILSLAVVVGWMIMGVYSSFFAENSETKLILNLSSLMLPYMVMICTVAILAGILNVHEHFAAPAAAPVILNIFIITATVVSGMFVSDNSKVQVYFIAVSVLMAGIVQLLMQFGALKSNKIRLKPQWDIRSAAVKKTMRLMGPMIIGLTATQINTLADDIIAWVFSGSDEKGAFFILFDHRIYYPMFRGSVAHLNYAQRLYQFPLGVIGISLATAIFPVLSRNAAQKDMESLTQTLNKGVKLAISLAIPATAGLILISPMLIKILFEHGEFTSNDTQATSFALRLYSIGLCGYFSQHILTVCFYSLQNSKMPVKSALLAIAVNLPLNLTLIWFLQEGGLALSTALCSYLQVVILTIALKNYIGHKIFFGSGKVIFKTLFASAVMYGIGVVVIGLTDNFEGLFENILRLIMVLMASAVTYTVMTYSLDIKEIKALIKLRK